MLLQVCLLLDATFAVVIGREFSEGDPIAESQFKEAVQTHTMVCSRHYTCAAWETYGIYCCGSCTCDMHCHKHGSCCLGTYYNFTHGQDSVKNSRYSCVGTQYLPGENTDFPNDEAVWMITKCDPKALDTSSIELCTQPGDSLEAVVPVTDPLSNTHYRNKFCAHCNNVPKGTPLINWKLQIESYRHLSFPDDDFLQKISATRGNIFFKQPQYVHTLPCDRTPEYTIESCNETGLWTDYNETTEAACNSFVDPFNYTYKNYFCYLCNTGAPASFSDMVCPFEIINPGPALNTPQFVAEVDLDIIRNGYNQDNLICEVTQFRDDNMMMCRDVFCHEHRTLSNGMCISVEKIYSNGTCFSVFIKLTPVPHEKPVRLVNIEKATLAFNIKSFLKPGHVTDRPGTRPGIFERAAESLYEQEFQFFYKASKTGHLDYVVVYINTVFQSRDDKNEFLEQLMSTKMLDVAYIWETEHVIAFSVELAVYNLTMSDQTTKVLIPSGDKMSVDELTLNEDNPNASVCRNKEIVQLNQLHWCPYIKLDVYQVSVKIEMGYLRFFNIFADNIIKVLSKWEYELHDDVINICFDDYLDIYHIMKVGKSDLMTFSEAVSQHIRHLKLCVIWLTCAMAFYYLQLF